MAPPGDGPMHGCSTYGCQRAYQQQAASLCHARSVAIARVAGGGQQSDNAAVFPETLQHLSDPCLLCIAEVWASVPGCDLRTDLSPDLWHKPQLAALRLLPLLRPVRWAAALCCHTIC